jgi:hypothetical protein
MTALEFLGSNPLELKPELAGRLAGIAEWDARPGRPGRFECPLEASRAIPTAVLTAAAMAAEEPLEDMLFRLLMRCVEPTDNEWLWPRGCIRGG